MRLHADDAGFVRAPAALVYRRLTDAAAWPRWWPGTRVRRLPPRRGDEVWAVELTGSRLRRLRFVARLHGWRHDRGFLLDVEGDVDGTAEFWLEDGHGGTVVHHVLAGRSGSGRPQVVRRDYRRAVRRGLWGLMELLHLEARTSAGLPP